MTTPLTFTEFTTDELPVDNEVGVLETPPSFGDMVFCSSTYGGQTVHPYSSACIDPVVRAPEGAVAPVPESPGPVTAVSTTTLSNAEGPPLTRSEISVGMIVVLDATDEQLLEIGASPDDPLFARGSVHVIRRVSGNTLMNTHVYIAPRAWVRPEFLRRSNWQPSIGDEVVVWASSADLSNMGHSESVIEVMRQRQRVVYIGLNPDGSPSTLDLENGPWVDADMVRPAMADDPGVVLTPETVYMCDDRRNGRPETYVRFTQASIDRYGDGGMVPEVWDETSMIWRAGNRVMRHWLRTLSAHEQAYFAQMQEGPELRAEVQALRELAGEMWHTMRASYNIPASAIAEEELEAAGVVRQFRERDIDMTMRVRLRARQEPGFNEDASSMSYIMRGVIIEGLSLAPQDMRLISGVVDTVSASVTTE